jgi:hypothetical protein
MRRRVELLEERHYWLERVHRLVAALEIRGDLGEAWRDEFESKCLRELQLREAQLKRARMHVGHSRGQPAGSGHSTAAAR